MSFSSQAAYDLAWAQQIDKEYMAAERIKLRHNDRYRCSSRQKVTPHFISGLMMNQGTPKATPIEEKTVFYSTGIPFRSLYPRRNNLDILRKFR